MNRHHLTRLSACLWMLALTAATSATVDAAAGADNYKVADGIAIYLGILPAAMIQGHPVEHAETTMHDESRENGGCVHLLVAIFDANDGERITDAEVTAQVMEGNFSGRQKPLEPMVINSTVTFGNYFALPNRDQYTIKIRIRRPGSAAVTETEFVHGHFPR